METILRDILIEIFKNAYSLDNPYNWICKTDLEILEKFQQCVELIITDFCRNNLNIKFLKNGKCKVNIDALNTISLLCIDSIDALGTFDHSVLKRKKIYTKILKSKKTFLEKQINHFYRSKL